MNPRKHHYLPQFYLRNFSDDGRKLWQIDKSDSNAVPVSITDIAAIRDYHRLDYDDAEDPFELERRLSAIEGVLSQALRSALSDGLSNPEVHHYMMQLVALLRARVPAMKTAIENHLRDVVRLTALMLERRGKLPKPPPGLENAFEQQKVRIAVSNWKCLEYMFRMAADETQLSIFLNMHPTLVAAAFGEAFLTCDQPVALYNSRFTADTPYGVSLIDLDTEISIPLSNRLLLWLTWDRSAPRLVEAGSARVAEFNRRSAIMAINYVFAPGTMRDRACALAAVHMTPFAGPAESDVLDVGTSFLHIRRMRPVLDERHY